MADSIIAKIRTLFEDKEGTIPLFPRTKIKAVSDDDGTALNILLNDMNSSISTAQSAADSAKTMANNAMPKSGGIFTNNVALANTANHIYQLSDTVSVLVGHSNGEFVISTNNNGTWNELVRLNTDGSVKSGALMPKSGGTFTAAVAAATQNNKGSNLRNIVVQTVAEVSSATSVSTNRIILVRK